MICPVCGKEISDGMRFCMACGAKLYTEEPVPMTEEVPVAQASVNEEVAAVDAAHKEPLTQEPVIGEPVIGEAAVNEPATEAPAVEETVSEAPVPETVVEEGTVKEGNFAGTEASPMTEEPPKAQPVVAAPVEKPVATAVLSRFDEDDLIRVSGGFWTGLLTFLTIFLYAVGSLGAIAVYVVQYFIEPIIPLPDVLAGPTYGALALVVVLVALFLVFAVLMMLLGAIRDINKSRKHLKNIEYMMLTKF